MGGIIAVFVAGILAEVIFILMAMHGATWSAMPFLAFQIWANGVVRNTVIIL